MPINYIEMPIFENDSITDMNKQWIEISLKNGLSKEDLIKHVEYILDNKPNDSNFKRILNYLKSN